MEPELRDFHGRPLISVKQVVELSDFTESYVRRLLRNGTLPGRKIGRDWFTTEEAVREYLALERKPGPKP